MLIEETKRILDRFGVSLDPSLDEQQLVDAEVIHRLISTAALNDQDTVLEIGAGCGNITVALSEVVRQVLAVEKNEKFFPILEMRISSLGNVELIQGDALKIKLPIFTKLVSNLPYSICEAFIWRLTQLNFEQAAVIVSSSFARIISAEEGDPPYSKLSLVANTFFTIERIEEIKPNAYYPPPGGSTSVVRLTPREPEESNNAVLRQVLLQGNRKLKNALRDAFITSSNAFGGLSTKRESEERIPSMELEKSLLEKRVSRLSLPELQLIISRL